MVLLWCVVIALVTLGLYAVAPWILPARVIEGPMVQLAGPDAVTLVWYTTRPVDCTLVVDADDARRTINSSPAGRRHSVRVDGLAAGRSYRYRLMAGTRALTNVVAFQTNKEADQRFTFVVFGDSGRGTRAQYQLAVEMDRATPRPDLLVHTGDVVYPDGARFRYNENFFAPYRSMLARIGFWPCLGNHDVEKDGSAPAYMEVFELPDNGPPGLPPERNYWFDYGSARFVVLDTNFESTSDALLRDQVAPWIIDVFARPAPHWRFVITHHPPHTAGKYAPDERLQRTIVPAIEQAGVDIVFSGHDHNYQRFAPLRGGVGADDGVVYIVTGAGGAKLYDLKPRDQWPPSLVFADSQRHGFTQVTIDGETLTLRQYAIGTPKPIDEFTLTKLRATTQPQPAPAPTPAETQP